MLKKAAGTLGGDCLLCGARSPESVCPRCADAMTRARIACPRCALPMAFEETCARCLRHPPAFDAALAAFEYRFPLDRLVQRFKFAGDLAAGRWLAQSLAQRVGDAVADVLVPVPLTRARLARRGFNQAQEIARIVGRERRIRVAASALARLRETAPQPGLGIRARHDNLVGAFRCDAIVAGAHVAVVDDVMTTGATAQAIAQALKDAGARRVSVWAVARTPEPGD